MKSRRYIIVALLLALAVALSCSTTRTLKDGEYLLRSNKILVNDKSYNASELSSYLLQTPNSWILGTSPQLVVYNWGGEGKTPFQRFFRKLGVPPVVYNHEKVDATIKNISDHLRYLGYYGSVVESDIRVNKRMVYVTYYVALGKRYKISSIDYNIPTYGTFKQDWDADFPNVTLKNGMYLSEKAVEEEAERSAKYFRTKGYYGFNKSYYFFEADTLANDGNAAIKATIQDYALGDSPSSAREHKKYKIGEVTISKPKRLKIRSGVLETLNTLRPGQLYNEQDITTTYSRFTNVGMLTGVNVNTSEGPNETVDCNISLKNSGLQGFKVNLEASVNSTALIGISPQLTYYHRNLFHGGEVLNLGIKGNFQFRPKSTAYSTEFGATASLSFPKFIGLPMRVFKGEYVPRTEVAFAFNYQDRPEFTRTLLSGTYSYIGRFNSRFSYQFTPIRINITKVTDIDEAFMERMAESLFTYGLYMPRFDFGISTLFYYTTDNAVIPTKPFHYIRVGADLSGNLVSIFNSVLPVDDNGRHTVWGVPYAQYVRGEINMGRTLRFGYQDKQSLALHFMGGIVIPYGNSYNYAAPVEKLFYAGGASSMRGWQARTLGPGNADYYQNFFAIPSAVGELKLEANIEYRFPIIWKLEGALFVDAGNIWNVTGDYDADTYADRFFFDKSALESTALDWGLGIRLNFGLILLRVDGGIRLHDPARAAGNRWIAPKEWFPHNYALHFGVGYPF